MLNLLPLVTLSSGMLGFTAMSRPDRKERQIIIGIFLLITGVCGLTSGGHIYVTDGAAMYFMSASLVDHRWIDVDPSLPNTGGGKHGPDGRYYMPFGFLQPLLAVPFLLLGRFLKSLYQTNYLPFFAITIFNWVVSGCLGCTMYYSFRTFEISKKVSLLMGLAIIFSTPFWVYSQTFFTEPLTALMSLLAWLSLRKSKVSAYPQLLSGALSGMITWVRPLGGLILPPLFLYFLLLEKKKSAEDAMPRNFLERGLAFTLPAVTGVLGYLSYNLIRFGNLLETGYDKLPSGSPRNFTLDVPTGLKIFFLSPGKSVFVFAPIVLLAPLGFILGFKQKTFRDESVFQMLTALLYVGVLCRWARIEGGVTWGPRLLLPILPFLFLALVPLLKMQENRVQILIFALLIFGCLVQIPGVFVNFSTYIAENADDYYNPANGSYMYQFNPFPGHLHKLRLYLSDIPKLQPKPPHLSTRHLEQVNPDGVLDVWWLLMWHDGVPKVFIYKGILILMISIFSGCCCIRRSLKLDYP